MTSDAPLSHDDAVELLEPYVDGRLDPAAAARVEAHVAACPECGAILSGVDAVDLGAVAAGPSLDERAMRRTVRRTLLGVAGRASGIVVLTLVLGLVASTLLVQPLLLSGDGTAALARATYELPTLVQPGATVEDFTIASGVQSRTNTTTLHMQVGSGSVELGTVTTQRRLLGRDEPLGPFVSGWAPNPVPAREVLERLGRTSVATVAVQLPTPLSINDAQTLIDDLAPDVSNTWAGFDIAAITDGIAATGQLATLGASTCGATLPPAPLFGATSADAGGSFPSAPASVNNALASTRDAVTHVADHPELAPLLPMGWSNDLSSAATALDALEPGVALLVLTGPSDALLEALDTAGAVDARVLGTATYNWTGPVCG